LPSSLSASAVGCLQATVEVTLVQVPAVWSFSCCPYSVVLHLSCARPSCEYISEFLFFPTNLHLPQPLGIATSTKRKPSHLILRLAPLLTHLLPLHRRQERSLQIHQGPSVRTALSASSFSFTAATRP